MDQRENGPQVVEPEVLPRMDPAAGHGGLNFNVRELVRSPIFWFLAGAAVAYFAIDRVNKHKRQ
jgi:hypothetical protein